MSAIPTTSLKSAGGSIIATADIANAAAAGTIAAMDLSWNPRGDKQKEIILPTSEAWMLVDCYVDSSAGAGTDVNPVIEIRKDQDRLLDTSQRLNSVLVTSNQRPNGLHGNLLFEGGSHMTMTAITTNDSGGARNINAIFPFEKQG